MQRRIVVLLLWLSFVIGIGGVVFTVTSVQAQEVPTKECTPADIVFVLSDAEAARAVETLYHLLAIHRWAYCPEVNYRIEVINGITGDVMYKLHPVPADLASWSVDSGLHLSISTERPQYRLQWRQAFRKALDDLHRHGIATRRQLLVYAGDIAIEAGASTAQEFVQTEIKEILEQYPEPEVWILSGEEDPELQQVRQTWKEVISERGGILPQEDRRFYSEAVEYLEGMISILQREDKAFLPQKVGCDTHRVPTTDILGIAWIEERPRFVLQWRGFSTSEEHDNVISSQDHRGIIVTDPPAGEMTIQCEGALVGFAQIGRPGVKVDEGGGHYPQDRGQEYPGGRFKVYLLGWQGENALALAPPYPNLILLITTPQGNMEQLAFHPASDQQYLESDLLPRREKGTYHWELEGAFPYNGIDGGTGQWEVLKQEGKYQVYGVSVVTLQPDVVGAERADGKYRVVLHDSLKNHLAVRPVVVRVQVQDEDGEIRSPQELFAEPEKAFRVVLSDPMTGQQVSAWLTPKSSFWYGELGRELTHPGRYRLEIFKAAPLASDMLVWDTSDPWRTEVERWDPLFHRPLFWEGAVALLIALLLVVIAWNIYLRISPLSGILEFRDERTGVVIRKFDLSTFGRRRVFLGRKFTGFVLPPIHIRRRGKDGIRLSAGREVKALDLTKNEPQQPFMRGMVVQFYEGQENESRQEEK